VIIWRGEIHETAIQAECGVTKNGVTLYMCVQDGAEERWRHDVCGSRALTC
jgi:hypothetical protein